LVLLACLPPGARQSSVHGLGSQDAGVLGPGRPGARRRAGHRRRNGNGSASRRGVVGIVAAAAASAASARGAPSRAECSVDLKLGGLGEFGAADRMKEPAAPVPAGAAAPSASPMKRPRSGAGGAGGGAQCPSCAVDGCKADLSKCRDYHRRHKVCEAHSKTPVVVVAGREMRFCQQCSRYIRNSSNHSQFTSLCFQKIHLHSLHKTDFR